MTRAAKALAHLGETDPALAVLALGCRHVDGNGETLTRDITISYGPSFMSFGLAEQVGVVAHHVLHVALRHSTRQAALAERLGTGFDRTLFALASDGIINETLLLAGHALPRPAVTLLDLLSEIGSPAKSGLQALREWDTDRLAMYLHADPQRSEKARNMANDMGFSSDLETSDEGQSGTAADWRNKMVRAIEAGRKAGTGIGMLGASIADMAPSRVPWEVQLRGLLAKALSSEPRQSYRRPSRQWLALAGQSRLADSAEPVFQPGLARDAMRPRVAVGVDTSSSIDPLTLSLFCSETEGVSRRSGAEVYLLAFDEAVHEVRRLDAHGWRGLRNGSIRTGGGTDYVPLIAEAGRLDPSVLVVLTDLDAPFGTAPPFPVLWAVPRPVGTAPFGRVLEIGD